MAWNDEPPAFKETAEQVCTPKELDALMLKAHGYGIKTGSRALHISEATWRYRIRNAIRKINAAQQENT
jgi:DNA-binding CsgD family transcriptional regulator